jgi:hypothetical protein
MGTLRASSYDVQPGDAITLYIGGLGSLSVDYYIDVYNNGWIDTLYGTYVDESSPLAVNQENYTIPSDANGEIRFTLYTSNDNALQDRVYVTASILNYDTPTLGSFAVSNTPLVQGMTQVTLTATVTSAGSGDIECYVFSDGINSKTVYTSALSASATLPAPKNYGNKSYTVRVYNTYNKDKMATCSTYVYQYSAPYFSNFKAYRSDANKNPNIKGLYITYEYQVNYSSINNTNIPTVTITCDGSNIKTVSGANGAYVTTYTYSVDMQHSIYATVVDTYGGKSTSSTINFYPSGKILNISPDGNSIGVGGDAPNVQSGDSGAFGCYWPAYFYGNATIDGDLTITGSLNTSDENSSAWSVPEVQRGSFTMREGIASTESITFAKQFTGTPFVSFSIVGEYANVATVYLTSVNKSGFQYYNGANASVTIRWIAIYV